VVFSAAGAPTLRDAVHDLAGHLEAGGQTRRERRGEVDGHPVGDHRRVFEEYFESLTGGTHHMALALGARAMHSSGAMQRPEPRQHPFGATRTRAALTELAAYDFAQV
jgi:CTP:molybdopterin cytidylyltransferase MocA